MSKIKALFVVTLAQAILPFGHAGENSVDAKSCGDCVLLEIILENSTCVPHENFPIHVKIVNPNDFSVVLPGFEMGYVEPVVELLKEDGNSIDLRPLRGDSARLPGLLTIPAKGEISLRRLLYDNSIGCLSWPIDPGVFSLQGRFTLGDPSLESEPPFSTALQWERPIAQIRVVDASPSDREAWSWLGPRLLAVRNAFKSPSASPEPINVRMVRLYSEFLERYPNSVYASAIRWETAQLIANSQHEFEGSELVSMIRLLENCVNACLDGGGAYEVSFLSWDPLRGGNLYLEIAMRNGKWELLERLANELDQQHPDDVEGSAYRRLLVAGATRSVEEMTSAADEYNSRFPSGNFGDANIAVRYFRRQRDLADTKE